MTPILECRSLTKKFGKRTAVNDVSFSLNEGDILGLSGPNGAGKSTLLKMITGLIWPQSGQVLIRGLDVHQQHSQAMRQVGAIIEYPSFIPDINGRRNLDIMSGGHGVEYLKKRDEIIRFVELEDRVDEKICRYSTGMKQRLGLALVLLPDSNFVILDEPTNGLDPGGMVEIRSLILEYNRKYGTTILITSHLLHEMEALCTIAAVMKQGKLVAFGPMSDLLEVQAHIRIVCDRPEQAVNCLAEVTKDSIELLPDGSIVILADANRAAEFNRKLNEAGFDVHRLETDRQTLEDFFLTTLQKAQ
jgi:ABC-2 type transport system ATP-binding protein